MTYGMDAQGKRVIIFGGTYRIGLAIARGYVEAGAQVVVTGRSEDRGVSALGDLEARGGVGRVHFLSTDITDHAALKRCVEQAATLMGGVDVAVVSASGRTSEPQGFRPFVDIAPSEIQGYALTHWVSKALCVKAVLPEFERAGGGRIVIVTSDAGRTPTQGESLIGAGAAATIHMIRTLAKELLRFNITINGIAISLTDTRDQPRPNQGDVPGLMGAPGQEGFGQKMREKLASRQSIRVMGQDVANAALYLGTDASRSTTGQTISINGGIST